MFNDCMHRWARGGSGLGLPIALLVLLASYYWGPALFAGKAMIHGDSIIHSLPLMKLNADTVYGHASELWQGKTYGGHALYSESQSALANPLTLFFSAVVTPLVGPIYSVALFRWLIIIGMGLGMIALCRTLGASPWASAFAAILVPFAEGGIAQQSNLTYAHSLLWVPWTIWAMERWLKRPAFGSAALFGAICAFSLEAGYAQTLHATIIYLFASLLVIPFQKGEREAWLGKSGLTLLVTGGLAVLVALGLSAVQWIPTLELAGLSHRGSGTPLIVEFPWSGALRGFFFKFPKPDIPLRAMGLPTAEAHPGFYYEPSIGSLFVCLIAALALVFPTPARIKGHMIGVFVLIQIAITTASPFFPLYYQTGLIPGLKYFRILSTTMNEMVVGLGVLAAFGIDGMMRWRAPRFTGLKSWLADREARPILLLAVILAAFWWAVASLWPHVSINQIVLAGAGAASIPLLDWLRRRRFIPAVLLALLIGECLFLRLHLFNFRSTGILARPASVDAIQARPDWREFKLYERTYEGAFFAFTNVRSAKLDVMARRYLAVLPGLYNLMWGIPSMNGAMALPLKRRIDINDILEEQTRGGGTAPPGLRLIDFLSVRFISADGVLPQSGFKPIWSNSERDSVVYENPVALPRFQLYTRHLSVGSEEEALAAIKALKEPLLVIENPPNHSLKESEDDSLSPPAVQPAAAHMEVLKAQSTRYRFKISTARPVWFFMADANYPGWKAFLDGKETPLYSAQILGKAVNIPPGEHELIVRFRSLSFLWGLWITLGTLAAVSAGLVIAHPVTRSRVTALLRRAGRAQPSSRVTAL